MGRKTIREEIRKKEAALKHAENTIKELKATVNAKNHEIKELHNLLNSDDPSTKELKELLSIKTKDLEQNIRENERIEKELAAKHEKQRAMNLALSQTERELDSVKKAMQVEEQALKIKLEEKGNEARESLDRKNAEIAGLQASLNTKERDLEKEIRENEKIRKQVLTKEEKLTTLLSVMNEKDKQREKLNEALRDKEQEFANRIRDKDSEIGEIKSSLMAAEKELQTIKSSTFWQRLKFCFRNY
jgi:chromosome segregation ATPase